MAFTPASNPFLKLPKGDLHAHILLSAPFECYQTLSGGKLSRPPRKFSGLQQFVRYVFENFLPLLSSIEAHRVVIREAFLQMISDNVVYSEPVFDLFSPARIGTTWDAYGDMVQEEIESIGSKLKINPEIGFGRERDPMEAVKLAKAAIRTRLFAGVDLYGDELAKPIEEFIPYFDLARESNLKIKMHSGEVGDAERMLHEVSFIGPDEVQHGISAAESPDALQYLREKGIALNICPTSNCVLSIVREYQDHPIRKIVNAGVPVTINTDDFGIFGMSLSGEYHHITTTGVLHPSELERSRQRSLTPAS